MKECWFVVEAYCMLAVLRGAGGALRYRAEPLLLAFALANALLVLVLAVLTYRGKRLAARLLALHIIVTVALTIAAALKAGMTLDAGTLFGCALQAYLLAGAVRLWRVRELPVRLGGPPAQPPTPA